MNQVTMSLVAGLMVFAVAVLAAGRLAAQPPVVTDDNLQQMIATAKTPAEHEAIAAYYDNEAANNERKVELHRASKNIYTKTANWLHCDALIKSYQLAADEDKALAAGHRQMARRLETAK